MINYVDTQKRERKMNSIYVGYDSANYYALQIEKDYLLIDIGFPGTYRKFLAVLKKASVAVERIRFLFVTHFHPDHAGIAQDLKNASVTFLLADAQVPFLDSANRSLAKYQGFQSITSEGNAIVPVDDPAAFKKITGIGGVVLATPGHSDDSISIVIDGVGAFVGDLHTPELTSEPNRGLAAASWEKIRRTGAKIAYPGHGVPFHLPVPRKG